LSQIPRLASSSGQEQHLEREYALFARGRMSTDCAREKERHWPFLLDLRHHSRFFSTKAMAVQKVVLGGMPETACLALLANSIEASCLLLVQYSVEHDGTGFLTMSEHWPD
jgi:hypothetical protein